VRIKAAVQEHLTGFNAIAAVAAALLVPA
jgi:hypothetical protein